MGKINLPPEIVLSDKTPRTAVAIDRTSGAKQTSPTALDVLLVGQMVAAATVAANVPVKLLREDDGANYFGAGSILDVACRAAFLANPFVLLSGVGVTDAGTKATVTLTFVGNAATSTTFRVRIAGVEYAIDVTVGDTPTIIATNLVAKVNADKASPVTATNAAGVVTFTADNGGTVGNGIAVAVGNAGALTGGFDAPAAQVVTTATLAAGKLTGGTGVVSFTNALAACTGKRYHKIALLADDSASGLTAKLHTDTEGDGEHLHGELFVQGFNGTLSAATTLALALNASRGVVAAINGSETWSVAIAAAFTAAWSREETPTRPLNGMVLNGVLPPTTDALRWSRTETRTLLDNGVTPLVVVPGNQVTIMRAVVTGVKNAAGDFDYSMLDVTDWQALDFFRDNIKLMMDTSYKNARWADSDPDGLLPTDVATPEKVTIDLIDVARDMETLGVLQNVEAVKDQFLVEKNGTQCIFSAPAMVVKGMHEKLGKVVNILRLPLS
jgi:phage tail sheath gpL-like